MESMNSQESNKQAALNYLANIKQPEERARLIANHHDLITAVVSYQTAVNALEFVPISDKKKAHFLDELANEYAQKIEKQGAAAFNTDDIKHAFDTVEKLNTERKSASAQFFHENIDNLLERTRMVVDPRHSELKNAHYHYVLLESSADSNGQPRSPEVMAAIKERMTKQIAEKGPESFAPVTIEASRNQEQTR